MGILYVLIVFLAFSLIVVIHEFGHFVAGKIFGVRIETFSVGIGKRLFGIKWGDTDYRVSLFPIGGYVAFAGISDTEGETGTGAPDEYPSKPPWQRIIIAAAGPAMNVLTGFILAVLLFMFGAQFTSPVVGAIVPGTPAAEAGLQPGDRVLRIDGKIVNGFTDIRQEVALSDTGKVLDFTIRRGEEEFDIPVSPRKDEGMPFPSIGINPTTSNVVQAEGNQRMLNDGFRNGDKVIAVNGEKVEETEAASVIRQAILTYPIMSLSDEEGIKLTVERKTGAVEDLTIVPDIAEHYTIGCASILYPIAKVEPDKPADIAGIKEGDYITAINGNRVYSWEDMVVRLSNTSGEIGVTLLRGDSEFSVRVLPHEAGGRRLLGITRTTADQEENGLKVVWVEEGSVADEAGLEAEMGIKSYEVTQEGQVKVIDNEENTYTFAGKKANERFSEGTYPFSLTFKHEIVKAASIGEAVSRGFSDCVQIINKTYLFLAKLVSAELSPTLVSGPVGIIHISYKVLELGFTVFLHFLVLISINLAVVNLLPLPILDGGNIVLLIIEWIKGSPVSRKAQAIIINIGLVMIIAIFLLVTGNDIYRLIFGFGG
ncbi:MAG: RIP metalloprotease RseP [Planctomycetota bacterium]|nr:RIP metalloprotease RseP [Planctomycetota bacterium]